MMGGYKPVHKGGKAWGCELEPTYLAEGFEAYPKYNNCQGASMAPPANTQHVLPLAQPFIQQQDEFDQTISYQHHNLVSFQEVAPLDYSWDATAQAVGGIQHAFNFSQQKSSTRVESDDEIPSPSQVPQPIFETKE